MSNTFIILANIAISVASIGSGLILGNYVAERYLDEERIREKVAKRYTKVTEETDE